MFLVVKDDQSLALFSLLSSLRLLQVYFEETFSLSPLYRPHFEGFGGSVGKVFDPSFYLLSSPKMQAMLLEMTVDYVLRLEWIMPARVPDNKTKKYCVNQIFNTTKVTFYT